MRQRSLLEYVNSKSEVHECKYCHRKFKSLRGLNMHLIKVHNMYSDEDIRVIEDGDHVKLIVKIRRTLYNDLMSRVERAGVDLPKYLLEAFTMGDLLFDKEVQRYASQKIWNEVERKISNASEEPTYIE